MLVDVLTGPIPIAKMMVVGEVVAGRLEGNWTVGYNQCRSSKVLIAGFGDP